MRRLLPVVLIALTGLVVAVGVATSMAGGQSPPENSPPATHSSGCHGAAAMQQPERCLRSLKVSPSPRVAPAPQRGPQRNRRYCRGGLKSDRGLAKVCALGVRSSRAVRHIAVIGDSHSAQWRPALDRVGKSRGWSLLSTVASECDFRVAPTDNPECRRWRAALPRWLERHPEVDTVIFGQVAKRSKAAQREYLKAWGSLPPSVERIVVLHDTPLARPNVRSCITSAVSRGKAPGIACAYPRQSAIRRDAAAIAAASVGPPMAQVANLSRYFCSATSCYPVIGGVLVYADGNHQTPQFNSTLAPYLGAELDRLLGDQ